MLGNSRRRLWWCSSVVASHTPVSAFPSRLSTEEADYLVLNVDREAAGSPQTLQKKLISPTTTLLRRRAGALSISRLQAFFEHQLNLLAQGTPLLFCDFVQS